MEVLVCLRREIPPDYLGRNHIRLRGYPIPQSDTQETIWNTERDREMARPLTPVEHKRIKEGIPRETVLQESFWWMRPDGIAVLPPTGNKTGTFCILEHKRMSDYCEQYLVRVKNTAENQYASLRSTISTVIQRQSWKVDQVNFITDARSVDKQDF